MRWRAEPEPLAFPKIFNLRADPFETADKDGIDYTRWLMERVFVMVPAQQYIGKFLAGSSAGLAPATWQQIAQTPRRAAPVSTGCGPVDQTRLRYRMTAKRQK